MQGETGEKELGEYGLNGLNEVERNLLVRLAVAGEGWLYDFSKSYPRSSVSKALAHLSDDGLIRVKRIEMVDGRKRKCYDVSFLGLVAALSLGATSRRIKEVAESHASELPLVFGKWNYFAQKKVDNAVEQLVCGAARDLHVQLSLLADRRSNRDGFGVNNDKLRRDFITYGVLFLGFDVSTEWLVYKYDKSNWVLMWSKEWVEVLAGDDDLKKYVFEQLCRFKAEGKRQLAKVNLMRNLIQNPSDAPEYDPSLFGIMASLAEKARMIKVPEKHSKLSEVEINVTELPP